MSDTPKMWLIAVQNPVTKEWAKFLGQGRTMIEAVKDGIDNVNAAFRPSSSGGTMPAIGIGVPGKLGVTLTDGRTVCRTIAEFDSDVPFDQSAMKGAA